MRLELAKRHNCRSKYSATFVRYGKKSAYKGEPITTLLFENVTDCLNKIICDHIWFTTCKGFEKYKFEPGDKVSFEARVKTYLKGYLGHREFKVNEHSEISKDYKLSHPNNIIKLSGEKITDENLFQLELF